jgi:hypothetical protein
MSRSSQAHKLDTRGYNSLSERKALSRIQTQHGTDTVEAILVIEGLWSSTDTITVTVNIGGGDLTPSYSPSGNEDASAAASGIATQVAAETGVSASAVENTVRITKTTAGSVDVVSAVIT